MKKLLLTFVLTLTAIIGLQAATPKELDGRWVSNEINFPVEDPNTTLKACFSMRFDTQGYASFTIAYSYKSGAGDETVKGNMYVSGAGTYKADANKVVISIYPNSLKPDAPMKDITVGSSATITKYDLQVILEQFAKELATNLGNEMTLEAVKMKGAKMTCTLYEENLTFNRVKAAKTKK